MIFGSPSKVVRRKLVRIGGSFGLDTRVEEGRLDMGWAGMMDWEHSYTVLADNTVKMRYKYPMLLTSPPSLFP